MKTFPLLKRTLSSYPTYKVIAWTIISPLPCTSSAARLAQLDWISAGLPSGRSRVQTPAGPTFRVLNELRSRNVLPLL